MDYSAVSQIAKRFEQKSKVNDKIKESLQKVITVLKEIWMSNVETPLLFVSPHANNVQRKEEKWKSIRIS